MSILSWPKRPKPEKEIASDWDTEIEAMRNVGEWLATVTPAQAFRIPTRASPNLGHEAGL